MICLECRKELKSIAGTHLRSHGMTIKEYREKFGLSTPEPKEEPTGESIHDPNAVTNRLSQYEKKYFSEKFDMLFRQADMDPSLEGNIRDVVLGQIYILRAQSALNKVSQQMAEGFTSDKDIQLSKSLLMLIRDIQKQNLDTLNALNLTREKKMSQKRSVETTPSRITSAYERVVANLTKEQAFIEREDEFRAVNRLKVNLETLLREDASQDIDADLNAETSTLAHS